MARHGVKMSTLCHWSCPRLGTATYQASVLEQLRIDAEASAVEVSTFARTRSRLGKRYTCASGGSRPSRRPHQRAQAIEAVRACRWARRTRTPSLGGHGTIATAAAAARRRRCRGLPRADLRLFSSVLLLLVVLYDDAAAIRTPNNELSAEQLEVLLSDWQKLAKGETWTPLSSPTRHRQPLRKRILALAMDKFVEKYGVCIARPLSMSTPAGIGKSVDSIKCRVD